LTQDVQGVRLSVNGTPIAGRVEPRMTLADFLRAKCGLTGTPRLRTWSMRRLHSAAGRGCRAVVSAVRGPSGRHGGDDGRRNRVARWHVVSRAVGFASVTDCNVASAHQVRHIPDRITSRSSRSHRRRDTRRVVRELLPVHRLPGHRRRRSEPKPGYHLKIAETLTLKPADFQLRLHPRH
jgi:hypothetical protein